MPTDFSFINKLGMDNLYPVAPRGKIKRNQIYPLFERFKQEMDQLNLQDQVMDPSRWQYQQGNIPPPEVTKPMDVVFNDKNISETARALGAAKTVHEIDLNRNALSPYQAGQLALRDKALEQQESIASNKLGLSQRKMNDTEKRTLISEIRENKNLPDADKIKLMADVESGQITQRGDIESRLVGERGVIESGHIRERGALAETLEQAQARHAIELATHKGEVDSKTSKLPTQERTATLQKAEQAKNSNPSWAKYIKIVPGGGFAITAPGILTGPDAATYKAINDYIYGTTTPAKPKEEVKPKPQSKYQVEVR